MFSKQLFTILIMLILVPSSQAMKAETGKLQADTTQYFCTFGASTRTVNIHYGDSIDGLPCEVTYKQQNHPLRTLLRAERNVMTCESKAKNMAVRLGDRGWNCSESNSTES